MVRADGSEGYDGTDLKGHDIVRGGDGNDTIFGDGAEGSNDDFIQGDGAEGGDDELRGDEGNDIILGGGGQDSISGGLDRDIVVGGVGEDRIAGNEGSDLILAGAFNSTMDETSILFVQAEWISPRSLSERITNLRGTGTGERANGSVIVNKGNLQLSDRAVDTALGGEDGDWLLADIEEDLIPDIDAGDIFGFN